ncbi:MAG TPA: hypothetical protein DHW39_09795 [Erysipelotrichaceae bacterium]|nr:hypothetical protein [Erysipelotrichaceae bacterium]
MLKSLAAAMIALNMYVCIFPIINVNADNEYYFDLFILIWQLGNTILLIYLVYLVIRALKRLGDPNNKRTNE